MNYIIQELLVFLFLVQPYGMVHLFALLAYAKTVKCFMVYETRLGTFILLLNTPIIFYLVRLAQSFPH